MDHKPLIREKKARVAQVIISRIAAPMWRVISYTKALLLKTCWMAKTAIERRYCLLLNRKKKFKHALAVATMFKNEGRYLDEWISFHSAVGVDHFFLYNNDSTDNYREVLSPWISQGKVTLIDWSGPGRQISAFNNCIKRFRSKAQWIAFLDMDEFLFSPKERDLRRALKNYTDVSAIFVYWILFGSSGHQTRPSGSVIGNYTNCLDLESARSNNFDHGNPHFEKHRYVTGWAKDGKSIVNPRLVKKYYVHKPEELWVGEIVDELKRKPVRRVSEYAEITCDIFRINHYWSRSIEDITNKAKKGNACWESNPESSVESVERWMLRESELNKSKDETLVKIWDEIKKEQSKKPK
jgi:hypothetical protein